MNTRMKTLMFLRLTQIRLQINMILADHMENQFITFVLTLLLKVKGMTSGKNRSPKQQKKEFPF